MVISYNCMKKHKSLNDYFDDDEDEIEGEEE